MSKEPVTIDLTRGIISALERRKRIDEQWSRARWLNHAIDAITNKVVLRWLSRQFDSPLKPGEKLFLLSESPDTYGRLLIIRESELERAESAGWHGRDEELSPEVQDDWFVEDGKVTWARQPQFLATYPYDKRWSDMFKRGAPFAYLVKAVKHQ